MLKQTSVEPRTLFLKLFTQELVLNSKPKTSEEEIKKEIEKPAEKIEEVKKESIKEISALTKPIEKEEFIPSILKVETKPVKPLISQEKKITPLKLTGPLRPIVRPLESLRKYAPAISAAESKFTMPISSLPEIGGEINLGKLGIFLLDKEVTEVECPGPDKFIFVRKAGQVNLTRITLSQEEINEIIKSFSEKARIPVISGVFKTSVENLTLTAIISEFVGSRFIIYKSSPYSILEQQTQQLRQAQLQGKLLYSKRLSPRF